MKFLSKLLSVFLAVIVAMPSFAKDRIDSNVRFNDLYGEVSIRPDDDEDDAYEYAELDTIIYQNDRIRTKEESGAILGLEDMSTFVIKPETILIIRSKEENVTKMEMLAGHIWGNIKKMAEGENFGFEMSQCVAGIKGTTFGLSQSRDGFINKIDVVNGSLEVYAKTTGGTHFISAGQSLIIDGKQKKIEIASFSIEEVRTDFMNDLKLRDKTLDDTGLKNKINKYIDDINKSSSKFEKRYIELKNIKKSLDFETAEKLETLRLESNRYKGALDESRALLAVAAEKNNNQQNTLKVLIYRLTKEVTDCSNLIDNIAKYAADYKERLNTQTGSVNAEEELSSKIAFIDSKINVILLEARDIIDETGDRSSFSAFKEARKSCEQYLADLDKLSTELLSLAAPSKAASLDLRTSSIDIFKRSVMQKHETAYKYIQSAMKKFASVSEVSTDIIKNMKDLEKEISDSVSAVDRGLKEYDAISRTPSVEAKRKYVSAMTRILASYDKATRYFNKSQRIAEQVQRNFSPSAFKTDEYYEIIEYWQRAQDSMNSLGIAATQLKINLEDIKSQLEQALGG